MSSLLRKRIKIEKIYWKNDPRWHPERGTPKMRLKTKIPEPRNIQVGPKNPYFISLEILVTFLPHTHYYIATGLYV